MSPFLGGFLPRLPKAAKLHAGGLSFLVCLEIGLRNLHRVRSRTSAYQVSRYILLHQVRPQSREPVSEALSYTDRRMENDYFR